MDGTQQNSFLRALTMNIAMGMPITPITDSDDAGEKRTKLETMKLEQFSVWSYISANFFTWILLAGFLVLPSSFSSLEDIETSSGELRKVLQAIRNIPLLTVAYVCCAVGGAGMCCLWYRQRHNYIWLLGNIFFPAALNGLSGLVSTLVNVYTTPDTTMGVSSTATLIVTGACTVICGILTAIYWFWLLGRVKTEHGEQQQQPQQEQRVMTNEVEKGNVLHYAERKEIVEAKGHEKRSSDGSFS